MYAISFRYFLKKTFPFENTICRQFKSITPEIQSEKDSFTALPILLKNRSENETSEKETHKIF